MFKKTSTLPVLMLLLVFAVTACSPSLAALPAEALGAAESEVKSLLKESGQDTLDEPQSVPVENAIPAPVDPGLLAAYQSTLVNIYEQVNPSVVNIQVSKSAVPNASGSPEFPFFESPDNPELPGIPNIPESPSPFGQGLGSGFVWDEQGNIITNNHVVAGADEIEVTFADGTVVPAELIGADPDSDLAVIHVDLPSQQLIPVEVADSNQLRVGQLAIAIGNPFGLDGTMTVGIISALGRSLPASDNLSAGPVYRIPDVIQTDAPINPGNSGGVLLNDRGQVIGVTAAIESPVRANAGIGFVIPTAIVSRVVPQLISEGFYAHPYLGISGVSLYPDLAEAMKLEPQQKGALVGDVVADGPADKAGISGSSQQVTIDGFDIQVGGDVITAIDEQIINNMDDLIAFLSANTEVGQSVTLTVLRDGEEQQIEVNLEARPDNGNQIASLPEATRGRAWLGIMGLSLTPDIAEEMDLSGDQGGVLIEQVQSGSPADQAGLQGSFTPVTIDGQEILIGGDVITAVDGTSVASVPELGELLQVAGIGEEVNLTVIRDGKEISVTVTLAEQP
jgi:S1-C subfamily serine protease